MMSKKEESYASYALAVEELFDSMNNEISNEEYLANLPTYKAIADRSLDGYLKQHLEDSIKKEWYELAQYIKEIADKRGVNV